MPTVTNCTITQNYISASGTGGGIYVSAGVCLGKNNIIYNNDAGQYANYHGIVNLTYSCSTPLLNGTGNLSDDPMFVNPENNFSLQEGSPCIDAGDPTSPLDPDSTVADMGCFYYDQNITPSPLEVTLIPYGIPIQIPATGGTFEFNIEIANNGTSTVSTDIWTMVTLPNGSEYGPIIDVNFELPPGLNANRDRFQAVPASAPGGIYTYDAYLGVYPDDVWDEDHFDFEKLTDGDGTIVTGWNNWGEDFGENNFNSGLQILPTTLLSASPNPFNPTTTIRFDLSEAGDVSLTIYDLAGREVAELMDGYKTAGYHEITFDGTDLSSGVYFVWLTADGGQSMVQKVVLMK